MNVYCFMAHRQLRSFSAQYKLTETSDIANIVWEIISMLLKTKNTYCFGVRYMKNWEILISYKNGLITIHVIIYLWLLCRTLVTRESLHLQSTWTWLSTKGKVFKHLTVYLFSYVFNKWILYNALIHQVKWMFTITIVTTTFMFFSKIIMYFGPEALYYWINLYHFY